MITNGYGAIMLICGLVAAFVVGFLAGMTTNKPDTDVAVGAMVFFAVTGGSDFLFRWKNNREKGRVRFIHPKTGGMFWFIPLWALCGLFPLVAFAGLLIIAAVKESRKPQRQVTLIHEISWTSKHCESLASLSQKSVEAAEKSIREKSVVAL